MHSYNTLLLWISVVLAAACAILYFTRKSLRVELDLSKEWNENLRRELASVKEEVREKNRLNSGLEFKVSGLRSLIDEKASAFPWLLSARTEFDDLTAERDAQYLENKKHPAEKAAELVREYRAKAKVAETKLNRVLYRQRYAEKLFPWLSELLDEDLQQMISDFKSQFTEKENLSTAIDPAQNFLSQVEYSKLSEVARNQLALDRYERTPKSKWQIGREFERYVGFLLEEDNYDVSYFGATQGLEDLGRDLIATRAEETLIVQCKYWASAKTIHEKHVYQLYGTFCDYVISGNIGLNSQQGQLFHERDALHKVRPLLLTTAKLSQRALLASQLLNVEAKTIPMEKWNYPKIKCNLSQRDGTRIYHLPFDQQYDAVKIDRSRGEFFATTCEDAERLGFRRAWRWKGIGAESTMKS